MRPEFMLVEIAYHGATLPAVTHALELMENLSPPPVSNAVWINAAASTSWHQWTRLRT